MIELLKITIDIGELSIIHLDKDSIAYQNLKEEINKSKKRLKDLQAKPQ